MTEGRVSIPSGIPVSHIELTIAMMFLRTSGVDSTTSRLSESTPRAVGENSVHAKSDRGGKIPRRVKGWKNSQ
jgi:hypothetical protein